MLKKTKKKTEPHSAWLEKPRTPLHFLQNVISKANHFFKIIFCQWWGCPLGNHNTFWHILGWSKWDICLKSSWSCQQILTFLFHMQTFFNKTRIHRTLHWCCLCSNASTVAVTELRSTVSVWSTVLCCFFFRHDTMSVTFTDGSKSTEKKKTPTSVSLLGGKVLQSYSEIRSHVWMSHHTVKCEHTYVGTTKFQFNTSNYTSLMEDNCNHGQGKKVWHDDISLWQSCSLVPHYYIF